jgi:2-methylcitrate dehydratase PrpD
MKRDPLGELVSWCAAARYEDLPTAVVEASKTYLTNTAAAMLAGASAPGAPEAVRQVKEWGGKPESTVVLNGFKVPAPLAAFANGVIAHAVDFDDTQVGTGFHPNVTAIPALLAAAETAPQASGKDLLLAHVVALEAACRMVLAATNRAQHPWLTTTLFGVFGATVAAGKAIGLREALLRQAMGIVYSSASGNRQGLLDGTLIQRVQPGFCAQAAVSAVALARQGITGAQDVFEGRYGLYPSYYGEDYAPEALTEGLGRDFRMLDLALKPYPCCSYAQEPIEATLELAREHGIEASQVDSAVAWVVSKHAAGLVDHPFEPRSCPQVDAQFSMQYVLGAALARKRLGIAEFQDTAFRDAGILETSRRVRVEVDAQREGCVELKLKDGRTLSHRVPVARGHPKRPMQALELTAKLRDCAAQAGWDTGRSIALQGGIARLEQLPHAADFVALLAA